MFNEAAILGVDYLDLVSSRLMMILTFEICLKLVLSIIFGSLLIQNSEEQD